MAGLQNNATSLEPVWSANLDFGLTDNLSLETFYQFDWEKTDIEPRGTFFVSKKSAPGT